MNLKFPPAVKRALKLKIVNIRIIKSTQNKFFLPLNIKNRNLDLEKTILLGNTTLNDLKIILPNLYEMSPENATFSLSEEYLNKIKEIKNMKNKQIFEKEIDESNNNNSLYELLSINNNIIPDLKPEEKISVGIQRKKNKFNRKW